MPKVGRHGLDMMYRTCTIQVNLDFSSEADMARKMKLSLKLQSLATALFAASPFTEGKPTACKAGAAKSGAIRIMPVPGLLPQALSDGFTFESYVEWAL